MSTGRCREFVSSLEAPPFTTARGVCVCVCLSVSVCACVCVCVSVMVCSTAVSLRKYRLVLTPSVEEGER